MSRTNNHQFQTNSNLNASAKPSQTLHQQHTAHKIGFSARLSSSSSVPTVNPKNFSPVNFQKYIVPFVAMNKSVKNFDGFDHQYTPEEQLHQ